MKTIILTILATLLIAVPATAAVKGHYVSILPGHSAVPGNNAVACTAFGPVNGGGGFRCKVGGDYRGLHGVIITTHYLKVTRYTGFNRYRVAKTYRMIP